MIRTAIALGVLLSTAACSGDDTSPGSAPDEDGAIHDAAQAYSDAYLTGDGDAAYALLSERCQDRMGSDEFATVVAAASGQYGDALKFKSFEADLNGEQARVTYTYDVAAINQTDEPWVNEGGWKNDDC